MKRYRLFVLVGMIGLIITGCGQKNLDMSGDAIIIEKSNESVIEENGEIYEATLEEVSDLLGMMDSETAELLGGGEENWSAGNEFYIGRNYQIDLYGTQYSAHTSCDSEGKVMAVSVWIVCGERQVTDDEVQTWIDRISEMTGTEPIYDNESSEAGSRNCRWIVDSRSVTMYRMADTLSINFNPLVGELK